MKRATVFLLILVAVAVGVAGGYWLASARHEPAAAAATGAGSADKRVLYWYDPMYPQHRFDKPGKSPFMDMQLVPKYAGDAEEPGSVTVSPAVVQNLGIRTAEVKRGSMTQALAAVGAVEYNERSVVLVQARANGFVERLYVKAALDSVRQGAPLVEMLVPDWAAAQAEYLLLRKRGDTGELAAAARQRLLLLGMTEAQIGAVERAGATQARITLTAPVSGVVAELGAREGMTVASGATLFRLASLGTVWVVAEVPEMQAAQVAPGSHAEVRVSAYPNDALKGRVSAILPEVNAATRTLRARIEVANPDGRLKPGMFANVSFLPRVQEVLLVPTQAVIRTGERNVVILAEAEGRFRVADVEPGMESGAETEIRKGLKGGERVVVSGQFLIDSEASLRSTLSRLESSPAPARHAESHAHGHDAYGGYDAHRGHGRIVAIDLTRARVELDHGPIASMKMPAMKMGFAVADKGALAKLRPGDHVEFTLRGEPDKGGEYVIDGISRAGAK